MSADINLIKPFIVGNRSPAHLFAVKRDLGSGNNRIVGADQTLDAGRSGVDQEMLAIAQEKKYRAAAR